MPRSAIEAIGLRAETRVFDALARLPAPWQFFPTVEWRNVQRDGESIGEADAVVFHPQHGLIVFEIKAGAVDVRDGVWYYASGQPMKLSPFSQARRNRYALLDKLRHRLSRDAVEALTVTHAAWFPDVQWRAALPGSEAPSRAFVLDRSTLADPAPALLRLLREAAPAPQPWTRAQQQALKELLAPDCQLLVPLAGKLDDAVEALYRATEQQLAVLRMLRSQSRLLVEGGAGSGKTLLACTLAREHAALGKSVLLTCYNLALAQHLEATLADVPGITVLAFHELVRRLALASGLPYAVPDDSEARARFFRDESADLLLSAVEAGSTRFDTLIVDEAADFAPTWWVGLEALGARDFSWYGFYDHRQAIYQDGDAWEPPTVQVSADFEAMAGQLRQLLRHLLRKESLSPERIVVLAPYRHTNAQSGWAAGLEEFALTTEMVSPPPGHLRVGTIQGFKGLEADVVILAGIDGPASLHCETLYVGASRARGALYVLALEKAGIG